jgi:hypothetical protein
LIEAIGLTLLLACNLIAVLRPNFQKFSVTIKKENPHIVAAYIFATGYNCSSGASGPKRLV